MADKYEEMTRQMRADGVDEAMIERFVAEEGPKPSSAAGAARPTSRQPAHGRACPKAYGSYCWATPSAPTAA